MTTLFLPSAPTLSSAPLSFHGIVLVRFFFPFHIVLEPCVIVTVHVAVVVVVVAPSVLVVFYSLCPLVLHGRFAVARDMACFSSHPWLSHDPTLCVSLPLKFCSQPPPACLCVCVHIPLIPQEVDVALRLRQQTLRKLRPFKSGCSIHVFSTFSRRECEVETSTERKRERGREEVLEREAGRASHIAARTTDMTVTANVRPLGALRYLRRSFWCAFFLPRFRNTGRTKRHFRTMLQRQKATGLLSVVCVNVLFYLGVAGVERTNDSTI
ncbi:unnamed protein product [Ectocarpus sp. 12 AP-2014]